MHYYNLFYTKRNGNIITFTLENEEEDEDKKVEIVELRFHIDVSNVNLNAFQKFSSRVMDYEDATLSLGNKEYIRFSYEETSVSFKQGDLSLSFTFGFAPG